MGVAGLMCLAPVQAREHAPAVDAVALSELPGEARAVHRQILTGGPFAYPKDGVVFANRERRLPMEPRGFYREYTVPTPGARDRGGRRMVCGGRQAASPAACYFSANHYQTFQRIKP